jgi:hypothetical protein
MPIGVEVTVSGHARSAPTCRPRRACQRSSRASGLRPLDTGPLAMARWLEGTGLVIMGLGRSGVLRRPLELRQHRRRGRPPTLK